MAGADTGTSKLAMEIAEAWLVNRPDMVPSMAEIVDHALAPLRERERVLVGALSDLRERIRWEPRIGEWIIITESRDGNIIYTNNPDDLIDTALAGVRDE